MLNSIAKKFRSPLVPRVSMYSLYRSISTQMSEEVTQGSKKTKNSKVSESADNFLLNLEYLNEQDDKIADLQLKELKARSKSYLTKYSILQLPSVEESVRIQEVLHDFDFSDFMKIEEFGLVKRAVELFHHPEVTLKNKIHLYTYIAILQTLDNFKSILEQAYTIGYDDKLQDIKLFKGALENQLLKSKNKIEEYLRELYFNDKNDWFKTSDTLMVGKRLILLSQLSPSLCKEFFEAKIPKRRAKKFDLPPLFSVLNLLKEENMLQFLITLPIAEYILRYPNFASCGTFLQAFEILRQHDNIEPIAMIKKISNLHKNLDWTQFMDYGDELMPNLSLGEKIALYWIFYEKGYSKGVTLKHREKMIELLKVIASYNVIELSFLIKKLMRRLFLPSKVSNSYN